MLVRDEYIAKISICTIRPVIWPPVTNLTLIGATSRLCVVKKQRDRPLRERSTYNTSCENVLLSRRPPTRNVRPWMPGYFPADISAWRVSRHYAAGVRAVNTELLQQIRLIFISLYLVELLYLLFNGVRAFSLFCTTSEIIRHFQCRPMWVTLLPVVLSGPSLSIRHLKWQSTYSFRFTCS